jgi:hypothetical protein
MSDKPIYENEPPPPIFRTWKSMYIFVMVVSFFVFLFMLWLSLKYH